jgi:indole-3-glycerol phosphate synthase
MSTFLEEMAADSRERVRAARAQVTEAQLLERARQMPAPPPLQLSGEFDLIAELKLRSPAAGVLAVADADIAQRVSAYARAGAAAVSVLTQPSRFDGSLAHLAQAVTALAPHRVPVMRKDFLVDPYQLLEARAAGAGGVLVILRMLTRTQIDVLLACARELTLFVLLEAFDEADLALMAELAAGRADGDRLLAGINCRDLTTLQVVPGRLQALAPLLPRSLPRVAESGVASGADARAAAVAGYDLALVGSALMQGADSAALARALLQAGRAGRRES